MTPRPDPIAAQAERARARNLVRQGKLEAAFAVDPATTYWEAVRTVGGGMKVSHSGTCRVCADYTPSTMDPLCRRCAGDALRLAGVRLFGPV
jgi:hypothetical protein